MLDFTATKEESEIIRKIVARVEGLGNRPFDATTTWMDIEACHSNGCPLDLEKLLNAPDFDFSHDVYGIEHHINRRTGALEGCFLPRCSK